MPQRAQQRPQHAARLSAKRRAVRLPAWQGALRAQTLRRATRGNRARRQVRDRDALRAATARIAGAQQPRERRGPHAAPAQAARKRRCSTDGCASHRGDPATRQTRQTRKHRPSDARRERKQQKKAARPHANRAPPARHDLLECRAPPPRPAPRVLHAHLAQRTRPHARRARAPRRSRAHRAQHCARPYPDPPHASLRVRPHPAAPHAARAHARLPHLQTAAPKPHVANRVRPRRLRDGHRRRCCRVSPCCPLLEVLPSRNVKRPQCGGVYELCAPPLAGRHAASESLSKPKHAHVISSSSHR